MRIFSPPIRNRFSQSDQTQLRNTFVIDAHMSISDGFVLVRVLFYYIRLLYATQALQAYNNKKYICVSVCLFVIVCV